MSIYSQLEALASFHLPSEEFVIVSSGALAIRGIRTANDLDIIVSTSLWERLAKEHMVGTNYWGVERIRLTRDIEILNPLQSVFGISNDISLEQIFEKADTFQGIKFISLEHLKPIKRKLGRTVDIRDIALIDAYIKERDMNFVCFCGGDIVFLKTNGDGRKIYRCNRSDHAHLDLSECTICKLPRSIWADDGSICSNCAIGFFSGNVKLTPEQQAGIKKWTVIV